MTYACRTNTIFEHDEQVVQVIDEKMNGDVYQKGSECRKAKGHEDLIYLHFEFEYRNVILSRGIKNLLALRRIRCLR
jgi:hypothetical protein